MRLLLFYHWTMITSTLGELQVYKSISPNLSTAIDYVLRTDFMSLAPGRYDVDGDAVFAIVNEYNTKPAAECEPESHRQYIDIQVMITGVEQFGYLPLTDQVPSTGFQPDNDVAFYTVEGLNYITLFPGQFIVFFPADIHQPEVFSGSPAPVKKLVMKVRV
jgi:YhcH/YjgK/YiaL family protein